MRHRTSLTVAAVAGLLLSVDAHAQFAIGQGNALDRNMRRGDTSVNPRGRDYQAEMRFRDAIVTGNAAGGLSFRGNVGYSSADEFRSRVSGDATYGFRRDSIVSGLAGMGVRGTDALQYQYSLTTGNSLPSQFTGAFRTQRFGGGALDPKAREGITPSLNAETVDVMRPTPVEDNLGLDRGALIPVRSTSSYTTTKSYMPTLVTAFGTPDGRAIAQTASPLRGIETFEMGRVEDIRPDLIPEGLRPKTAPKPGAALQGEQQTRPGAVPSLRDTPGLNFNEELMRKYDAYLDWRSNSGQEMDLKTGWRDSLTSIRDFLNQPPPPLELPTGESGAEGAERSRIPGLAPEIVELIRKAPAPEPMDSLLLTDPEQVDAYGAHIKAGERHLKEGRYFDAEERFTRALEHKRGDTFALAGRIHAQIGAGMYRSAALNLRSLLREHPEASGIQYDAEIMPQAARLSLVEQELRGKIEAERIESDAALLLAYIGFQTRDEELLFEALDELDKHSSDTTLATFIREIWVGYPG